MRSLSYRFGNEAGYHGPDEVQSAVITGRIAGVCGRSGANQLTRPQIGAHTRLPRE